MACTEARSPVAATFSGSLGVRIVTTPDDAVEAVESWSLSREPVVDVGSELAPTSWIAAPNEEVPSARTELLPFAPDSLVLFGAAVFGAAPEPGAFRARVPPY